jgi:hypothetical protein
MPVYDELYKFKINCIMYSRHEQGATHAGYAEQQERVGWPLQLRDQEQQIWFTGICGCTNRFDSYGFVLQVKLGSICGI